MPDIIKKFTFNDHNINIRFITKMSVPFMRRNTKAEFSRTNH